MLEPPNSSRLPERNPVTHAQHKKEVLWQITFPMLIGVLIMILMLVFVYYTITVGSSDLSRWADVSLIWLILPSLFLALIFLAFIAAFIYLISMVIHITPRYSRALHLYLELAKSRVVQISDQITDPIVKARSIWAVVRHPGKLGRRPSEDQ
jgi:sensor histidine kinase YesM